MMIRSWGFLMIAAVLLLCVAATGTATARTAAEGGGLAEVRERGVLRHIGIPYANFVTGAGDGFSVELAKGFADYLGVDYSFVPATWGSVISDLVGRKVRLADGEVIEGQRVPVKGDIIATGFTVLPWRKEVVAYSDPTFITQVWLIADSALPVKPIVPTGNLSRDIALTKEKVAGLSVLGVRNTCVDPALYGLASHGAEIVHFHGNLNELAPAVLGGKADATILDVPDSLVALQKWPGDIKILGPISEPQHMACAFRKGSTELLRAFNRYLQEVRKERRYAELVERYYPTVLEYFPEFFAR
ncbi:MAG: transporter substrate-binding domain-containing protein [Synergistales bacterium]|nr:transporter substrate-binding domain-containing protein [Synergistales bacterium]